MRKGFTLVELSIVLVIIGLLVGGVLTGQSLIRAAELRSITAQEQRYVTAVQTFRDKYFALPGDMSNATAYWGIVSGSSTGSDAACATAASTTTATCNGNGDGQVASTGLAEQYRFWQHLANAGLIEGAYNGIAGSGVTSLNAPTGRISSSLWYTVWMGAIAGDTHTYDGQYGHVLQFGGLTSNSLPTNAILRPEEAYNIDTKLDDGKPATGKVVAYQFATFGGSPTCSDGASSTVLTANYSLSSTALGCAIFFRTAY